jgi:hypothetical protein
MVEGYKKKIEEEELEEINPNLNENVIIYINI